MPANRSTTRSAAHSNPKFGDVKLLAAFQLLLHTVEHVFVVVNCEVQWLADAVLQHNLQAQLYAVRQADMERMQHNATTGTSTSYMDIDPREFSTKHTTVANMTA